MIYLTNYFRLTLNILKLMKQLILIIAGIILLLYMPGCGQSDKSKILEQYKYDESKSGSDGIITKKIGSWVKEGITCYGIVIVDDKNGIPLRIKVVHAKVISIDPDKIIMRSLENIDMSPVDGCDKFTLKKGDDWNETEGDLFQTKEDAIKFVDTYYPGLRMK
ncbi:MAG TPA: hypothetical protein DHV48_01720 [Prolixibacteraceae bacterium]|nr:MAG: hypothetical protein A2066_05480 [Bacteroidetes bacterium GWB2_41_8]HCY40068.1 hypothetical protein [Prolixibacteraceae bacterium]